MSSFPPLQAKLIYNGRAGSGATAANQRLRDVIDALVAVNIFPDTTQVEEPEEAIAAAALAVRASYPLVIACGGDGTIESTANPLVTTATELGILPGGTRNNVARSLGIPLKLADAARTLRTGQPHKIGAGLARVGSRQRWFLETFTIGLFSALYPHADAIQKGNFVRTRDLLATFANFSAANIQLVVDGEHTISARAHAVIGVNMPSTGAFFRLGSNIAFDDEHIDVFVYDRLDKLDFLVYGLDVLTGMPEDPAIQRIRAHHILIRTDPPLPVMADGYDLGPGEADIEMFAHSLNVIVPSAIATPSA